MRLAYLPCEINDMVEQALSDIRVIDLTHFTAGPYCTKLMAGFGADVIKVERPEIGDGMRSVGPFCNNKIGLERSIPFLWLNTGKKSITLDLKTTAGAEIFMNLVSTGDVVIENFAPRVMPGLGLGYDTLSEINSHLIMISISNFGQNGPYRDFQIEEIQAQAISGLMALTGESDKPPLAAGPAICQYSAGLHAYSAALLALFQRRITGQGQYADVSIMECGLEQIENAMTHFLQQGQHSKRGEHFFSPWGLFACRDGYVAVIGAPFRHWTKGAEIFEEPRLMDSKYYHARDRIQYRKEVDDLVQPWLKKQNKKDIFEKAIDHNLAFGFLASFDEVMESPQHEAREFFADIEHPSVGKHRYCGAPYRLSETPWINSRAPRLGEHNQVVYGDYLGMSKKEIEYLHKRGIV